MLIPPSFSVGSVTALTPDVIARLQATNLTTNAVAAASANQSTASINEAIRLTDTVLASSDFYGTKRIVQGITKVAQTQGPLQTPTTAGQLVSQNPLPQAPTANQVLSITSAGFDTINNPNFGGGFATNFFPTQPNAFSPAIPNIGTLTQPLQAIAAASAFNFGNLNNTAVLGNAVPLPAGTPAMLGQPAPFQTTVSSDLASMSTAFSPATANRPVTPFGGLNPTTTPIGSSGVLGAGLFNSPTAPGLLPAGFASGATANPTVGLSPLTLVPNINPFPLGQSPNASTVFTSTTNFIDQLLFRQPTFQPSPGDTLGMNAFGNIVILNPLEPQSAGTTLAFPNGFNTGLAATGFFTNGPNGATTLTAGQSPTGQPLTTTGQTFGQPLTTTGQTFGQPLTTTGQTFGQPLTTTTGQTFGQPIITTGQTFGQPLTTTTGQTFGQPITTTGQTFGQPNPVFNTGATVIQPNPVTTAGFPPIGQSIGNVNNPIVSRSGTLSFGSPAVSPAPAPPAVVANPTATPATTAAAADPLQALVPIPDAIPFTSVAGFNAFLTFWGQLSPQVRQLFLAALSNATTFNAAAINQANIATTGGQFGQGLITSPFSPASAIADTNPQSRFGTGIAVLNSPGVSKGTTASDLLRGNQRTANILDGAGGTDLFIGGAGADWMRLGAGSQALGREGDDQFVYLQSGQLAATASAPTAIDGGPGMDTLIVPVAGDPRQVQPTITRLDAQGTIGIALPNNQGTFVVRDIERLIISDLQGNIGQVLG